MNIVNKTKTSRRLRKLYRIKQRRLRHAVNSMVKGIVGDASETGASKTVTRKLRGIRNNNHKGRKVDSMIHNF